jgi:hypothetical protein
LQPKAAVNKSFGLNHFAGVVVYDINGFLEKNRDTFSTDLLQIVQKSKFKFLTSLFKEDFALVMGTDNVILVVLIDGNLSLGINSSSLLMIIACVDCVG